MLFSAKAIVIKTVKYSESSVIAKLYTRKFGIQSYMVRGVRTSKNSTFKPAQLLYLNLLEIVAYHKQNTEIQNIKEIRCTPALINLHTDFIKTAIGMFMAELLHKCIVEEEPNEVLFDFVQECIIQLDQSTVSTSLFPCWFMIHLSRFLGFEPKGEITQEEIFDMEEGAFTSSALGLHIIPHPLSKLLFELKESSPETFHRIASSPVQRNELLEHLITYYKLHHLNIGEIKSHRVLRDVLG
jgi:DNA repair protein RecO (recombination protein O)